MVYKAVRFHEIHRQMHRRPPALHRRARLAPSAPSLAGSAARGCAGDACAGPGAGAKPAEARRRGRAAGRARLLGPAAAAGPARSVASHRDPLPDRDRLSAVQLHRRRRQSGRLQCRSGAGALRRDQGHLHHPDAPLRDAGRCARHQPRRRHHRLAGGDAADARQGRFHRSLLPRAGALRVAARRRDAGGAARISRGQEGRRHRRHLA